MPYSPSEVEQIYKDIELNPANCIAFLGYDSFRFGNFFVKVEQGCVTLNGECLMNIRTLDDLCQLRKLLINE